MVLVLANNKTCWDCVAAVILEYNRKADIIHFRFQEEKHALFLRCIAIYKISI